MSKQKKEKTILLSLAAVFALPLLLFGILLIWKTFGESQIEASPPQLYTWLREVLDILFLRQETYVFVFFGYVLVATVLFTVGCAIPSKKETAAMEKHQTAVAVQKASLPREFLSTRRSLGTAMLLFSLLTGILELYLVYDGLSGGSLTRVPLINGILLLLPLLLTAALISVGCVLCFHLPKLREDDRPARRTLGILLSPTARQMEPYAQDPEKYRRLRLRLIAAFLLTAGILFLATLALMLLTPNSSFWPESLTVLKLLLPGVGLLISALAVFANAGTQTATQ